MEKLWGARTTQMRNSNCISREEEEERGTHPNLLLLFPTQKTTPTPRKKEGGLFPTPPHNFAGLATKDIVSADLRKYLDLVGIFPSRRRVVCFRSSWLSILRGERKALPGPSSPPQDHDQGGGWGGSTFLSYFPSLLCLCQWGFPPLV